MVDFGQTGEQPRYTTAATVGQEHARATWALAARERLQEVAHDHHAVIGSKELAEFVQRRSLIRTNQPPQYWIGDVLTRVSHDCARRGEPLLSALCVDAKGRVAAGYVVAVELHRGEHVGDADEHAARERLECYRRWGAALPPGGGVPGPVPDPAPATARGSRQASGERPARRTAGTAKPRAKAAAVEKPVVTCPVHFTVLPANGICDLCE
jgi:hypothetical protein